ncbi:MAG: PilC/PilY family type IV pilus protein [Halioglobus sp.]
MKMFISWILTYFLVGMHTVAADDTDAYIPGGSRERMYLHVVIDTGDTLHDAVLCTFGTDCGPPFMTLEAYRHLSAMYAVGEPVTGTGVFRAVLAAVIEQTRFDDIYLSLLISNHQDNFSGIDNSGYGGGSIIAGYQRLREHRGDLIALLEQLPRPASPVSHVLQPKETYFEWVRYIRGEGVALGQNTAGNFGLADPVPNYDLSIIEDRRYLAPVSNVHECPALFSLLYTQGAPAGDEDLNSEISTEFSVPAASSFTQFLTFLHNSRTDLIPQIDASVPLSRTWVVTSQAYLDRVEKQAAAGGSAAINVNEPVQLQSDLTSAFASIVDVRSHSQNPVFVEDVFKRGRVLDQLFVPMFSAQSRSNQPGNLKKLKLIVTGHDGMVADEAINAKRQIVDINGQQAIETTGVDKGRLRFDALTFWTDVGSLPAGDGRVIPNGTDGRVVNRGGAGQKIDGFVSYSDGVGDRVSYFIGDTNADAPVDGYTARQVFYDSADGQTLVDFNADALTAETLKTLLDPAGKLGQEALLDLIRWARGQDVIGEPASARSWLLGELLHSRPLALNYGATPGYSAENPNVRLFFGSGEGAFHILENTDTQGRESGREIFAFYPRESMATISWRHDNDGTTVARRYGVDGTPVVLKNDRDGNGTIDYTSGEEAIVYFGLRRGGTSYFALDVSNPDARPRLLWKISPTTSGDFDHLGLTFSTPLVGKVNFNGVSEDVLVFAGGYSGGWNGNFSARVGKDLGADDDTVGNAIYIVNARTGALVWKAVAGPTGARSNTQYAHAGLVDSIPSDVAALLTPSGTLHRLYVGDSGGGVWRIDLPPGSSDDENHRRDHWFITKLADLGLDASEPDGSESADRRFFHAPDLVQSFDEEGPFDGVLIQSGNRADPNETVVENALFYIKDRNTVSGSSLLQAENEVNHPEAGIHYADLADQTSCVVASEEVTDSDSCSNQSFVNGWIVRFDEAGEKGLSSPITDAGRIFASTFVPGDPASCPVQQGHGRLHVLRLADATAVANSLRVYELGEGIPNGAEFVGDSIYIPGGGVDLYDLNNDGTRDTTNLLPRQAIKLYRTYWREPGVDSL